MRALPVARLTVYKRAGPNRLWPIMGAVEEGLAKVVPELLRQTVHRAYIWLSWSARERQMKSSWRLTFLIVQALLATLSTPGAPFAHTKSEQALVAFVGPLRGGVGISAFIQAMSGLGYGEGRNIRYLVQGIGNTDHELTTALASVVSQRPQVIVAAGDNRTTMTAMRLTSTIPIVFGSIDDPVGSGIVADLSSPGRNATGLANQVSNLMVKQLELVREVFPDSRDVAL